MMNKEYQIVEEKNSNTGAVIKRYAKGKFLGKGGFAKCYEFESLQTKKKYAAKIIEKASLTRTKAKEKLASQIKIHKSLKSQYVVGFQHFFEDPQNVYILLELCTNQTLNEHIKRRKRITELQAKYFIHQIIMALKDIHNQQVIHRDLKLGNLFLTDKLEIRIGDFGLAAKLNFLGEKRKTMCGTPNYIAPQILENHGGHSYQVDIWSLGVIVYAILIGRPPFETHDVKATYAKIKVCNYSFPQSCSISRTAKNFIAKMLQKDPARRSTLDELLNDEFFTIGSFPKSLPLSTLACPPNVAFMKKFKGKDSIESIGRQEQGFQSTRGTSKSRKDLMTTERNDSLGKILHRAASIDKVQSRSTGVQRAVSTAALMAGKRVLLKPQQSKLQKPNSMIPGPHVWVIYSQQNPKFGVCYLLNSNATGMRFNDSTCLISNSLFTRVKYIEQINSQTHKGQTYKLGQTPESLTKKMKIINHYHKQLQIRKQQEQGMMNNQQRIVRQRLKYKQTTDTAFNIFVTKFYKTSKVNIFWFNNSDYQVIFKDMTQLLISQNNIVYVNKVAQRKYFQVHELDRQSQQVKKRMNYTIKIVDQIKNAGSKNLEQKEKQNKQNCMVRSSSVNKLEKTRPQTALLKGCASTTRLTNYRLAK